MNNFLSDEFLLESEPACILYHEVAKLMPIFDFHCHLDPADIDLDRQYENITGLWLDADHYKWRAMRAVGIDEKYITGDASDREKFEAWAATVPYTMANPLYHWSHLELKNTFGISGLQVNPDTADRIFEITSKQLAKPGFSARNLITRMNVNVICTTDDPVDSLEHHKNIADDESFNVKVLPTFRPDRSLMIEDVASFKTYLQSLAGVADKSIDSFKDLVEVLLMRIDYFHDNGCRISDHSLGVPVAEPYTDEEVERLFTRILKGKEITEKDGAMYKTALLDKLWSAYYEKGWVSQFHIGALRNNRRRLMNVAGYDAGADSIDDRPIAGSLSRFLDMLDEKKKLPKTILYTLDPAKNDVLAAMAGNFQDGSVKGKIQFGAGWWFNDQKDGIMRHLASLSNLGLLSLFVGMVTDSRSLLSYSRHEYFRRILCNYLGNLIETGELPADMNIMGRMVQDICYNNAEQYFML